LRNSYFQTINSLRYTLVDTKKSNLKSAKQRIIQWADEESLHVIDTTSSNSDQTRDSTQCSKISGSVKATGTGSVHQMSDQSESEVAVDEFVVMDRSREFRFRLVCGDAIEYAEQSQDQFELLIAAAFLDLVNIPETLPILFNALKSNGIFYFPINFDGVTHFSPQISPHFDSQVENRFHALMDTTLDGKIVSQSKAGRFLAQYIPEAGGCITSFGSSAWTVAAGVDANYQHQEAYFLNCILHFISDTVSPSNILDQEELNA